MDDHVAVEMELKHLTRQTRCVAEGQPVSLGGDGAVDHAAAVVAQVQHELRLRGPSQLTEIDFQRMNNEGSGRSRRAGQLLKQLVEAAVDVADLGRLSCRVGQIGTADAVEKVSQKTALEHFLGRVPIVIARDDQLVEITAVTTRGENERMRERLPTDGEWCREHRVERSAIVIAVQCVLRIDARTKTAGLRHI